MLIRPASLEDHDALWDVLEPTIRAGEALTIPVGASRDEALAFWTRPEFEAFVAEEGGRVVGTYHLRANQTGGGGHVANAGYATSADSTGKGVARRMCEHSLQRARDRGFRAMQFNFVVSTNERAVRLWQGLGFETVGRLPGAFLHPRLGYVDALVMFRTL